MITRQPQNERGSITPSNYPMNFSRDTQNVGLAFNRYQQVGDPKAVIRASIVEKAVGLEFTREIVSPSFPSLAPLDGDKAPSASSNKFLEALKEERGIKDPDALYKSCRKAMEALKEKHVLDKYVVDEDEAAVLCAIPILLGEGFSILDMVGSCRTTAPSKLVRLILNTLRKLPRYRGVMYIQSKSQQSITERKEGEITQPVLCIAFKDPDAIIEGNDAETGLYKEIFRVEEGWGYDMSDFVLFQDDKGDYGMTQNILFHCSFKCIYL